MFVYEPSLAIYNELLTTLKVTPPTPFAEQGTFTDPSLGFTTWCYGVTLRILIQRRPRSVLLGPSHGGLLEREEIKKLVTMVRHLQRLTIQMLAKLMTNESTTSIFGSPGGARFHSFLFLWESTSISYPASK
ncbi:hypothetical protein V6N13_139706 [Hibiscus sabdariffa]